MTDIVEKLRIDRYTPREEAHWRTIAKEAAAEIEQLRRRNKSLEGSIKYVCDMSARAGDLFNDYRGDQ